MHIVCLLLLALKKANPAVDPKRPRGGGEKALIPGILQYIFFIKI